MSKAEFINLLLEKLHPWYTIRFAYISDLLLTFNIGSTPVVSRYDHELERWTIESSFASPAAIMFAERCEAVMYGAARDDEGNLVMPWQH